MTDTTTANDGTDQPGPTGTRAGKVAPTIYDIAELAGVNPSTVSRALSKPGRVSAKTQQKIMDAAEELNYQVNIFARALPTGSTQTVGLIVSDITNPAFFDIIRGAETAAAARDYTLMLAESTESAEHENSRRPGACWPPLTRLILASPRLSDEEIQALAAKKPVVVVNRKVDGVASVVADLGVRRGRCRAAFGRHGPYLHFLCGRTGTVLDVQAPLGEHQGPLRLARHHPSAWWPRACPRSTADAAPRPPCGPARPRLCSATTTSWRLGSCGNFRPQAWTSRPS